VRLELIVFDEAALVEEQFHALAGGQFVLAVVLVDACLAAT